MQRLSMTIATRLPSPSVSDALAAVAAPRRLASQRGMGTRYAASWANGGTGPTTKNLGAHMAPRWNPGENRNANYLTTFAFLAITFRILHYMTR
jgi:hypothetical protein